MSIEVPHFRASADVLVRGEVIVEDYTNGVAGGADAQAPQLVSTGLVVDLDAEGYDTASPFFWNNALTVTGVGSGGTGDFSLPSAENSGNLSNGNLGIVSLGDQPSYVRFELAKLNGYVLPTTGITWELMIWPEYNAGLTVGRSHVIMTTKLRVIFSTNDAGKKLTVQWGSNSAVAGSVIESTVSLNDFAAQECWNHMVLTYSDPELKLYWNGKVVLSVSRAADTNTGLYNQAPIILSNSNSNSRFACKYSKLRMYHHALSSTDVYQNYSYYNKKYLFGGDLTTNDPPIIDM